VLLTALARAKFLGNISTVDEMIFRQSPQRIVSAEADD